MILLLVFSLLAAQDNIQLGKIIINADTPRTGDVFTEQQSGFVSVINAEEFRGKYRDVPELVKKEAGIQVRQTGGIGGYSALSLRGSKSDQVMVYIDGVLLNEAYGGGVDTGNIPVSEIESIEIYRGVVPANFAQASIGGAVNIKTRRVKDRFNAYISQTAGSLHFNNTVANVSGKTGKFDYLFTGGYTQSDNDYLFLNDNGTEWNSNDDEWQKRRNNDFNSESLLGKAGYDFTESTRIEVQNQFFRKNQKLPSWNNLETASAGFKTTRDIINAGLIADDLGTLHLNSKSRLNYMIKHEIYDDRDGIIGLGSQHNRYVTRSAGFNQFTEWATQYNILTWVFGVNSENRKNTELLSANTGNADSRQTYSAALEDTVTLFDEKLMISPALRYTYSNGNITGGFGYVSPGLGLKYSLTGRLTFKSNLAKYRREPSFFELTGDYGYFTGNRDLECEDGVNFDIGAGLDLDQYTYFENISFSAVYFHTGLKNAIVYVYDARGTGRPENTGRADINGFELTGSLDALKYFSFYANYTWLSAVNLSDVAVFYRKKLPGRFEHSLNTAFRTRYGIFEFNYGFSLNKFLYYDTANLLKAPHKILHGICLSLVMRHFTTSFEIKNIGNVNYEDFNGYPTPGRTYYLTLKLEY